MAAAGRAAPLERVCDAVKASVRMEELSNGVKREA
jgi:hypothetical protein